MTNDDRKEHLDWAKGRALEFVNQGDIDQAVISFISDLRKHPDLQSHPGINLLQMAHLQGNLTPKLAKKFINDCN